MSEKFILYLEDSEENISQIADVLKELNYKIELAKTTSLAEKMLLTFEPNLFIVSMDVTSTDPSDLIQKMKKNKFLKKIPFIFFSENMEEEVFFSEFKGADKKNSVFIKKPFPIENLVDIVESKIGLPDPPKGVYPVSIGVQRDLAGMKKENEQLKVELSELKGKLGESSKVAQAEVSQIQGLQKDVDNLKKMMALKEEELKLLKDDVAKKSKEVEKTEKKLKELKHEKEAEVGNIKGKLDDLKKEQEEEAEKHKKAQAALREFYKPKLANLSKLEEKVGELEAEVEKAKEEIKEKEEKMKELEKKVSTEKGLKDKLKKVLEEID